MILANGCWITFQQNQKWLTKHSNRIRIKKLYNRRDTSFQLTESKSALKKFAMQYRIDGKDWIDPDLFLVNAKQYITNLVINTRQTKMKLLLSCMMEKIDLKSGKVIAKEGAFHYKT